MYVYTNVFQSFQRASLHTDLLSITLVNLESGKIKKATYNKDISENRKLIFSLQQIEGYSDINLMIVFV